MRILVVSAHPVETSFVASLRETTIRTLQSRDHAIDDCDLYAEGFDPVLSREGRIRYHDTERNQADVATYVARLQAADALVLVFPVWNFGFPAMLKGYFDRVFLPGVAFDLDAKGDITLTLRHIRRVAAVCTYGADRWRAWLAGDPPRKFVTRVLRAHIAAAGRCDYRPHYDMNHSTLERRVKFLRTVEHTFQQW